MKIGRIAMMNMKRVVLPLKQLGFIFCPQETFTYAVSFPEKNISTEGSKKSSTLFPFMAYVFVLRIPAREPGSPAFSTGRESGIGRIKRFEL
jgi:hypothetical protein